MLDHRCNEHDQCQDDEDVEDDEEPAEQGMPSGTWVAGSDDPLSKDQVDDEEQQDPGGDKNIGCNGDADVARIACPDYAHDLCDYPCHAETEEHAGHDEPVAASFVDLEDCHVADSGDDEEDDEDAADGYIDSDCGEAA